MDREKRALLVVDGSATYSFYLTMLLKKLEYTVRSSSTAEGALQMLADSLPALVITDTSLSKMSGVDMLKQMSLKILLIIQGKICLKRLMCGLKVIPKLKRPAY